MALTRKHVHSFRGYDNSKDLWKALKKRFEGNSDIKKSKRDLLRKQYECFRYLENESIDELISRFYHLQTELKAFELKYPDEELVEKLLDALPAKFEMYTTLQRENPKFYEMTIEEAIGKLNHLVNSHEEDNSNGCGGHTCFTASGSGPHHQHPSRNTSSTSSANQTAIAKIAEDHWNVAMILRRAKRFLNRTDRKFIGGHSNAKVGFDKSKAKCYKCQNFGHFARECQKDKALASGFTRPSQGNNQRNNQGYNNSNNHNQSQGGTSNALVDQQDEIFDWGVHLEDALTAQTQVGLMAEIMEMMEAEEREASVADHKESTTAFALMAIGEASSSSTEVDSNSFAVISSSKCLGLKEENYKLQEKVEPLRIAALSYKENEKRYKDSIETLKKEKHDFTLKICEQQFHLDDAYKGLEKRNNEITKLQNEVLQLNGKIEKLKNSRFVVEHYESVVRQVNGLGLGTNAIPPPVSGKFFNSLIDIDLSCLDESSSQDDSSNKDDSSSKADSASNEEFFTASDVGSKNTCPEGVVSEELLGEQKVKKNIITDIDNCILAEPNIIESNEKLNVMHYGGYKNINQVKKEAFSAHYGLGYQENLQKYYIPKNQSSSGQTHVHQTSSPVHHAESSNVKSNEPYRKTYKEKRTCFHCGMVGHILVNCPAKNQGKRPIVSQPAVIPKSPPVKHSKSPKGNMVKPPVKPMVKPKITYEAKPYVSKRGKLPAKPCASTSGSAPTGEKPVVKLSKPQRRRKNKRLRKLEQLTGVQSCEASISSHAAVESKSTVPGHPKGTISNRWYVDSGCSQHMTGNMALLQDVKPFRGDYVAFAGEKGGSITWAWFQMVVSALTTCEQLKHNMLSVSQMCDNEYSVMFDKTECMILKSGFKVPEDWILMRAPRTNDTYQIDMGVATTTSSVTTCLLTKAIELDSILWHRKLGHISYQKMNHLVRNGLVTGVPKLRFIVADDCMPCKKGKQQRKSHKPKLQNSIDTPLELLHMDLFGPISIRSIGGTKDETADTLQYLILSLESLCMLKKGIRPEFSAPYTPQQNGVAERKNRTLIETARTMLSDAKLPVTFWAEAVNTACHVLNRVLVMKRHNKTCYELINNRPPNLDYLVPFDALFKSFNLPDLSADDDANVYKLFGSGDDSSFSTCATVPIETPNSNAASASGTHDSDNIEGVYVDRNDAQANPNTRVGNEAPADPINIESSSSGTQDIWES
ncbi:hypothetical protein L1987_60248 [Smallanthus sonchifolius]|uniref:Uncharacterized protein n=1 Tax=Smallanthus sonchifolius TaxID=185202 RepID=A0ACB9D7M1_9ASTR|nr:hypothetical protein L1987_60248 [Smallanthus sonchifolius]